MTTSEKKIRTQEVKGHTVEVFANPDYHKRFTCEDCGQTEVAMTTPFSAFNETDCNE